MTAVVIFSSLSSTNISFFRDLNITLMSLQNDSPEGRVQGCVLHPVFEFLRLSAAQGFFEIGQSAKPQDQSLGYQLCWTFSDRGITSHRRAYQPRRLGTAWLFALNAKYTQTQFWFLYGKMFSNGFQWKLGFTSMDFLEGLLLRSNFEARFLAVTTKTTSSSTLVMYRSNLMISVRAF